MNPEASASKITMYPRVKVRGGQEEYDDQFEFEKRSLQSLKAPEFITSNDLSSPDNSPTSVVRVLQLDSSDPGAMGNRKPKSLEENSTNIKASPVLRPRAVLSSPDNDQIIGSKNKTRGESLPTSKKNNSLLNSHTKCKVIPRPVPFNGSVYTRRELKEVPVSRNVLQSRKKTVIPDPSLKAKVKKEKLKPVQNGALGNSPMTKKITF